MRDIAVSANVIYPDIHVCVYVRDFMGTLCILGNTSISMCFIQATAHLSERKKKSIFGCDTALIA